MLAGVKLTISNRPATVSAPSKKDFGLMENVIVFMRDELIDLFTRRSGVEKRQNRWYAHFFFKRLVVLFIVVTVGIGCSDNEKASQTNQSNSGRATPETSPTATRSAPASGTALATTEPAEATTWTYENRVEAENEPITHRASVTSPTRLQFGFPYTGGSTVRLGIREREGDALVSLHVKNGVFNRSFEGGNIQIRFDNGPPITYPYAAAENGSATVIFLDKPGAIIRKLKSSRSVVVNLDFYNQGNRQFTFNTANLRWPY